MVSWECKSSVSCAKVWFSRLFEFVTKYILETIYSYELTLSNFLIHIKFLKEEKNLIDVFLETYNTANTTVSFIKVCKPGSFVELFI